MSWRREQGTPGARLLPEYPPPADPLADVLCSRPKCVALAVGWLDGVPYCLDCPWDIIERDAALDMNPWLALPDLDDR